MTVHIDPYDLTSDERKTLADLMEANGCRNWIAFDLIHLDGKVITYYSCGRRGASYQPRIDWDKGRIDGKYKRLRLRFGTDEVRRLAARSWTRQRPQ